MQQLLDVGTGHRRDECRHGRPARSSPAISTTGSSTSRRTHLGQLAASIHIYWDTPAHPDYSPCFSSSCWYGVLAPLSPQVPIVVGEFGELDCGHTLYPPFLDFADQYGISYLAWAWFVGSCAGPSLIKNYSGRPTAYGVGYLDHLASLTKSTRGTGVEAPAPLAPWAASRPAR